MIVSFQRFYAATVAVAELRAFPRDAARRKDTVEVGNAARLDCPYPYRAAADAAGLRFHWSRVTSEHDQSPVRIIPNNRLVVGLDGKLIHRLIIIKVFRGS